MCVWPTLPELVAIAILIRFSSSVHCEEPIVIRVRSICRVPGVRSAPWVRVRVCVWVGACMCVCVGGCVLCACVPDLAENLRCLRVCHANDVAKVRTGISEWDQPKLAPGLVYCSQIELGVDELNIPSSWSKCTCLCVCECVCSSIYTHTSTTCV